VRVLAVDWSGAAEPSAQRRAIFVAEAVDGELVALTAGRTRDETVDHLLDALERDPAGLVGLDFAFGFPAWWACAQGAAGGPDVWELAARQGEQWLAAGAPPFWGRRGRRRPAVDAGRGPWRRTELELRALGLRPTSVFQIGGAGAVGTGSVRGMPALRRVRHAGVAVWPFDPWPARGRPAAAEVYPRWCTGPVVKSRASERAAHLGRAWPDVRPELAAVAAASEDAFDAACTALRLSGSRPPGHRIDAVDRLEGRVLPPGGG